MRIICVLQNAWGDRQLPIVFCPNPFNKSAKVIRKMVGDNYYDFSNTTLTLLQAVRRVNLHRTMNTSEKSWI